MNSEGPPLLSLSTFTNAFKNHWLAAAVIFVATAAVAVLAIMYLPKAYSSEAMIFVKLGRETVSLDPTATTGSTISVLESRDNEINSIRDMLYSRGIVEKVVDRIGPDVILGDAELTDEVKEPEEFPERDELNSPRQKAIKALIDDTYVVSARKSSVLILNAKAASPELAQRVLKEYLDVYMMMHTNAHQTPESNKFFQEQARLLSSQWKESLKALQIAKEDAGVVSIEGARENLKEQTNTIESSLLDVSSRVMATEARLEEFRLLVTKNPLDQQRIGQDYLEAKAELSAMAAQKRSLTEQLGELLDRAAKLNRDEVTIGQLEKAVELQATNFAQYQELYEQTRIDEALNSSRFTNVRVVQEPSYIPKPVSPKKSLLAAAGLVAATTGAVLIAVFLELFWTLRRPRRTRSEGSNLDTEVLGNNEFLAGSSIANG